MPTVSDQDTRSVKQKDLAAMLDRTPTALSQAARSKYYCADYPVFEWVKWHPAGNQIEGYDVPIPVLKELLPEEEWTKFGIFQ